LAVTPSKPVALRRAPDCGCGRARKRAGRANHFATASDLSPFDRQPWGHQTDRPCSTETKNSHSSPIRTTGNSPSISVPAGPSRHGRETCAAIWEPDVPTRPLATRGGRWSSLDPSSRLTNRPGPNSTAGRFKRESSQTSSGGPAAQRRPSGLGAARCLFELPGGVGEHGCINLIRPLLCRRRRCPHRRAGPSNSQDLESFRSLAD
jgi:hypothetical protein